MSSFWHTYSKLCSRSFLASSTVLAIAEWFFSFKADDLSVDQRAFCVSVPKKVHDMQYISGLVVFHCGFPLSECVKVYLHQFWVLKFIGKSISGDDKLVFTDLQSASPKSFSYHLPFGTKDAYGKGDNGSRLGQALELVRICGFLIQTKVYLLRKKKGS
jgi:hypothetical protein